jgi:putative transposase
MRDYHIPLFPNGLYHVLNRANGDEALFRKETNNYYFIEKYRQHISPIAQTLAWCLLPNHYHFLVRINSATALSKRYTERKGRELQEENKLSEFITEQFANWQNAYAKAFNKMYKRQGGLFMNYLRRISIEGEDQLMKTVFYIHKNPVHHGFTQAIGAWPWTSYNEYKSDKPFLTGGKEVMSLFGTKESFIKFHQQPVERK